MEQKKTYARMPLPIAVLLHIHYPYLVGVEVSIQG
jgi:hypothetical protein